MTRDVLATVLVVLAVALSVVLVLVNRRLASGSERFVGVAPGVLLPGPQREQLHRERGSGAEEDVRTAPVRENPPERTRPGDVGLLLAGSVRYRDLAATLVDLVVRGLLVAEPAGRSGRPVLRVGAPGPDADDTRSLTAPERALVQAVARRQAGVPVTQLRAELGPELQGLAKGVVQRAWWRKLYVRGSSAPWWVLLPGPALALAAAWLNTWALLIAVVLALVLPRLGSTGAHRSAEGTALAVQTVGYQRFLAGGGRGGDSDPVAAQMIPWLVTFGLEGESAAVRQAYGGVVPEICAALDDVRPLAGDRPTEPSTAAPDPAPMNVSLLAGAVSVAAFTGLDRPVADVPNVDDAFGATGGTLADSLSGISTDAGTSAGWGDGGGSSGDGGGGGGGDSGP
ncbi:hypothetical protein [Barrientosiimonas humi]|uniref:hypothetical protein n=1 Tax=Barrientosiimonas humi TaxID=999931 RepID=UPI00370D2852